MQKTALILFIGVVVGVGAYLVATHSGGPQSLNQDLYPLYQGAVWGPIKAAVVDGAKGFEIESETITNITNIAASSTPFYDYYQTKLTQAGWTQDMSREAGGPGAEVSVFTKGKDFIVVKFNTVFRKKPANEPEQCPCDLTFSLISGTVQ